NARWQAEKQLHDLTGEAIQQVRRFLGADWVSLEGEGEARWETRLSTGGTVKVLAARTEGEYEGVPFAHWYVDGETVRPGERAGRLLSCGQMKLHRHEGCPAPEYRPGPPSDGGRAFSCLGAVPYTQHLSWRNP